MKFQRRKYIVSPCFHWKFVISFMVIALVESVLITIFFNFFAVKRLEELRWSVFLNEPSTGEVLRPLFIYVNLFSLIFVAVLLIVIGVWMLKKMNGPISCIANSLERIREGDYSSSIVVRKNDAFKDVAEALNQMLEKMKEKSTHLVVKYDEISQAIRALEVDQAKGIPVEKRVKDIIGMIQSLRKDVLQGSV